MIAPRLAVVGDHNPSHPTHVALDHAAGCLPHGITAEWLPTEEVVDAESRLTGFDGLWVAPGSPYRSEQGVLNAIRNAREQGIPLYGT